MTEMTDREFDAQIAQRLAGWTWLTCLCSVWLGPPETIGERRIYGTVREADDVDLIQGSREDDWWMRDEAEVADCPVVPHYSTTWEGMGLVVEAMRAKGWEHCALERIRASDTWVWQARLETEWEGECATADTAPRAVAIVALRVLEREATR